MSVEGTPFIPIAYPARLEIDYSAQYDRVKTLFRAVLIIPIAIIYGVLTAGVTRTVYDQNGESVSTTSGGYGSTRTRSFLSPIGIPRSPFGRAGVGLTLASQ